MILVLSHLDLSRLTNGVFAPLFLYTINFGRWLFKISMIELSASDDQPFPTLCLRLAHFYFSIRAMSNVMNFHKFSGLTIIEESILCLPNLIRRVHACEFIASLASESSYACEGTSLAVRPMMKRALRYKAGPTRFQCYIAWSQWWSLCSASPLRVAVRLAVLTPILERGF